MNTIAQQYAKSIHDTINGNELIAIARAELADIYSNNNYSWIEFCDGSVLSSQYGKVTAYKKLMSFHKNGVPF